MTKRKDLLSQDTIISGPEEALVISRSARIYCAGMPRLEAHGKSKTFTRKVLAVGRDRSNSVIIADAQVSKFHAVISFRKGTAYLRDTGSTNGTLRNRDRVPVNVDVELADGDVLMFGTTRITVHYRP